MNGFLDRRAFAVLTSGLLLATVAAVYAAADSPPLDIDQSTFVPIGGIDQWISIKGEKRDNPVLLVVHGGPGEAQWPESDKYKPWEKAFTVVQWDQRGAGHTYGRYGAQTPDVNLDRIAKDGIEVADYLCRSLGKKKIIVLGHSWGSIVAVRMVQLRPELFAAYVGTGQVASWKASVNTQFDLLLERARRNGDDATVKQFEAIGHPDPANAKQYFAFSKGLRAAMAPSDQAWLQSLRTSAPTLIASHPKDFQDLIDGMDFSAVHALADQMATDLPKTAIKIDTAFFVIQGEDDVITPTTAAIDYFDRVQAPKKELILIPGAGHFAFMTASAAFLSALTDKVRPVAVVRGAQ
ncbi:MAG: alpha/beta hydrolase [Rhizomicrobium sp.]|jgi:pimeloyl-ACP methyl ester carboxylesterase